MAIGCIWDGTKETAELTHFLNATFHCSARGSEVSLPKVTDLHVAEVNEDVYQYKILRLDIQRQKSKGRTVSV
ncbi:hypothetical protein IV203_019393 [Nitzschia inconspicua]|uniref:Uncharacterized protein n=1 Tax=Nitzschia inconspicua TaxID=303405 RepID=A0A9K3LYE1_9STRA|nr:hypothetical protein IV203_019393 [Nitzschia inconspicua]